VPEAPLGNGEACKHAVLSVEHSAAIHPPHDHGLLHRRRREGRFITATVKCDGIYFCSLNKADRVDKSLCKPQRAWHCSPNVYVAEWKKGRLASTFLPSSWCCRQSCSPPFAAPNAEATSFTALSATAHRFFGGNEVARRTPVPQLLRILD
jgi:hypothetical protein